jgi:hypothetical protein
MKTNLRQVTAQCRTHAAQAHHEAIAAHCEASTARSNSELVESLRWALDQIDDSLEPDGQQALEHARAILRIHS